MRLHIHWYRAAEHPYGQLHRGTYGQCRCGERIVRVATGGWQPVDHGWVETGRWTPDPVFPPPKPTDAATARP